MPVLVNCPGCGGRLEVDEQYAGHAASCPLCKAQFVVPGGAEDSQSEEAAPPEPAIWSMKTPEGRIYGPITRSELDRWVSEGRVAEDCQLRESETGSWLPADQTYAVLRPDAALAKSRGNPFAPSPFFSTAAHAPIWAVSAPRDESPAKYLAPHRGGLILALGILAFVVACPLLSFIAWAMGTNDLREMRAGRMDPSGMNMTQAGMLLGMLVSVATVISLVGLLFYILLSAAI